MSGVNGTERSRTPTASNTAFEIAEGTTAAVGSPAHELTCFSCGARVTRSALLMQIANETTKRAEAFIEISKKARSQPRER